MCTLIFHCVDDSILQSKYNFKAIIHNQLTRAARMINGNFYFLPSHITPSVNAKQENALLTRKATSPWYDIGIQAMNDAEFIQSFEFIV